MPGIKDIIADTLHRPFPIPNGRWRYYQEWNNVLFLHWKVPVEILRDLVPSKFQLDQFEGNCYVSLVAFTMEKIRPRGLPAVGFVSKFGEVNLRTYIDNDNKKGVYFLSMEAEKFISGFIAKSVSGLPYKKSMIKQGDNSYQSTNTQKGFHLNAAFDIKETLTHKSELDKWLTERYCLYFDYRNRFYRYDVHHKEWEIKKVELKQLSLSYTVGHLRLTEKDPWLAHYSPGVKVLAWEKERL
jgi:uncharacterized protein YqjF (DUF2071 family)